jgi:hypothetical protein
MRGRAASRLAAMAVVVSVLATACAGSGNVHPDALTASPLTHHQCDPGSDCTTTPTATANPSTTPTQNAVVRTCGVAPAGLVGAVLGVPTAGPRQFDHGRYVIQCVYGTDVAQPAVAGFYDNMDAAQFATLKAAIGAHGQNVTSIAFQDEAFTSTITGSLTLNSLYARKGSLVIEVLSTASLRAEEALERQIFANVYHH